MNKIHRLLGSGFYTGYIPFASGTFGSAAGLILYWLIPPMSDWRILLPAALVTCVYGFYAGTLFEKEYGKDPAECTIDEVAGMWIALLLLPKTIAVALVTFFLWRIIDIIKPSPAREAEALPGGYGIMMDDIIGGLYTCIAMNLLLLIPFVRNLLT
jgi:phosphatidylglycerophosphatase A